MKKFLYIFLGVIAFLLVVGFGVFQYVQTTPQYSLFLAFQAVKSHDYATFTKYVDVSNIVSNVIDKAVAASEKESQANSNGNEWEKMGEAFAQTLIVSMKPGLIQKAKETVQKEVETGTFQKGYSPKNVIAEFFAIKVKQDGKVADVTIPAQDAKNKPLVVKMRQVDGHWQVFDMDLDLSNTSDPTQDSSKKIQNAKFGQKVSIGGDMTLTVDEPQVFVEDNSFEQPKEGNEYLAVNLTYEKDAKSKNTEGYDPSYLKLKDADGHIFSREYVTKEPSIDTADTLEPGGKAQGYIVFQHPVNAPIQEAVYSNSEVTIVFTK